jgi:hypothetical protein
MRKNMSRRGREGREGREESLTEIELNRIEITLTMF